MRNPQSEGPFLTRDNGSSRLADACRRDQQTTTVAVRQVAMKRWAMSAFGYVVASASLTPDACRREGLARDSERSVIDQNQVVCKHGAGCEFNVVLALCVGHDSLFFKHAQGLTTVLVAKERVLARTTRSAPSTWPTLVTVNCGNLIGRRRRRRYPS